MVTTPTHTPGQHQGERFIALDSLRGLAAVMVVVFHMGAFGLIASLEVFRHAWLMVDFFFVLSGFVIAASYGDRLAGGFSRTRFMLLRLGRVVPLHAATVLAFLAFEVLFVRLVLHQNHDVFYFWRGFLLLDGFAEHTGNFYAPVSWSISVEVMLYLAAAVLFSLGRTGLAIAVAGATAALLAMATGWNHTGFGILLQRGVLGFSLGVLCFAVHRRWNWRIDVASVTALELALIAAVTWLLVEMPFGRFTTIASYPLFAATVLVFARDRGWVSRWLQLGPLVWIGTLSYSIYMTHMLLLRPLNRAMPMVLEAFGRQDLIGSPSNSFGLLTMELGDTAETFVTIGLVALVLVMSNYSWRYLEEPARQWSRRQAKRWADARAEQGAVPA
ncbi:acyltransferase family protein [Altererythrobacter sp. Root672]|uniref:acyltransferase family protein n=1 Tax=Altererythrobacter sp. Root672 TaxID=1736584 RepID=UPI000A7D5A3F|nr:acyltransferase [Altererythrobacter sp. Root672]